MDAITKNLTKGEAMELLRRCLEDLLGSGTYEMLSEYHSGSASQSQLATRHGVSQPAIAQRIRRAHTTLRRLKAMPPSWERKKEKQNATTERSPRDTQSVGP